MNLNPTGATHSGAASTADDADDGADGLLVSDVIHAAGPERSL